MPLRRTPRTLALALALAAPVAGVAAVSAPAVSQATTEPDPSSAVTLYTQSIEPLGHVGGVDVDGAAYGSSLAAKPGPSKTFFGLTDRGPNVDGPDGSKVEPLPDFTPAIGEFRLKNGQAKLVRSIPLTAADGTPYDGQVNTVASTGETITDLDGHVLPASPTGYDPEGLAVLRDGTFWVSDEYGPFITHFSGDGYALERLSPYDGTLPRELVNREPNKGMEGLTVTPDGKTLVGIMQNGLNAPGGPKSKSVSALRIVTVDLASRATHEYVYLLHNDAGASTGASEISAINDHVFLVDERDGKPEPGANKKLFRISLRGATDVGPASTVHGSTYDANAGGLLIGGQNLETIAGTANTADARTALRNAGVQPVSDQLFLDVAGLVTAIDPAGGFFGHDKVEGVAVVAHGRRLVIANDSDFGIAGLTGEAAPYGLEEKLQPNGQQDTGELLEVRMSQVPAEFR